MSNGFILKHGGYKSLISYQKAEIIYDATVYFTQRFLKKGDRTIDQWCRRRAQASKILLRPVWLLVHPKKWK